MVTSRVVRKNKSILKNKIDEVESKNSSSMVKLLECFRNNRGKYMLFDEIMIKSNVTSGGHSSQHIKKLVYEGKIKKRSCECHRSSLYMMP